jgi:hypothetical protein
MGVSYGANEQFEEESSPLIQKCHLSIESKGTERTKSKNVDSASRSTAVVMTDLCKELMTQELVERLTATITARYN